MKCDFCLKNAVTFIRYNGSHLCSYHFMKYIEKKIKREIRKQINLNPGDKIAVAVSGGKDSMVTLHLIKKIFEDRDDIKIDCITVDEGIEGYRPSSIEIVKEYCSNNIPLHIVSFKEMFDLTMDEVAPYSDKNSPCTYCGVFRRKCINTIAKKIGARYIATGHNLDDISQSILMNFVRADIEKLIRLGPHKKIYPGLVPRFAPLRSISEKESLLYAIVSGLKYHDLTCPYWEKALRNQYRSIIDGLESRSPGSKFSILSSYDRLYPTLIKNCKQIGLNICTCGEPASGKKCKACEFSKEMNEKLGC